MRQIIVLAALALAGCTRSSEQANMSDTQTSSPAATSLSDSTLARVASRRILFGHQSVGRNILDGVNALLAEHPGAGLQVLSAADAPGRPGGALFETSVGRNGDPTSKAQAFASAVDTMFQQDSGVALYKYCYVDFGPDTDPVNVFGEYKRGMEALQARHPGVTFVHVTLPLTTDEGRLKAALSSIRGRASERALNVKRNQYNQLLRSTYAGREPIFDLAAVESAGPDGQIAFFVQGSDTVHTLHPAWSSDGGHLNEAGQRKAAEQLLAVIAAVP